jgi:DNA repair protein RadC
VGLRACDPPPIQPSTGQSRPSQTENDHERKILYIADQNATNGFRSASYDEILAGARHALALRVRKGTALTNPKAVRYYLTMRLAPRECEYFTILYLDNRHRLIAAEDPFRGTIDGVSVHPREVVKEALKRNAAAVILSHNHLSGVAEPSQANQLITNRLRQALALVDIRVLGHLIVPGTDTVSFSERGRI